MINQVLSSQGSDWDVFLPFFMCPGTTVLIESIVMFIKLVPCKDWILLSRLLLIATNSPVAFKNINKNSPQTSQSPHTCVFSAFRKCLLQLSLKCTKSLGTLNLTEKQILCDQDLEYLLKCVASENNCCLVAQLCPTPWDPLDCSMPGFPVLHYLLKLMSIESMMPSNRLILSCPLLLPSIFPSIRIFSNELALFIRWPKYWSFCSENN